MNSCKMLCFIIYKTKLNERYIYLESLGIILWQKKKKLSFPL
jgi:hypothetical protein